MKKVNGKRRKPRKIPEVLTAEEQVQVLAALKPTTSGKLKNLCMVRLMLNAGLRSCEVVGARLSDLEFPSGKLKVRGKGQKDRIVWLADEDLALLAEYVESRPVSTNKNGALLFQTGPGKPIDTRFLRALLERLSQKAGLEKSVHPHMLRHTFASDLLRATKNLFLVSKALGHSDIGTTQIYLHLVDGEMEDAMKNLRNGG